jgi:hypothetical protein
MAIEYVNTLQGDILDSYNTAALVNLGQRMGAKGDSITIKNFKFEDLLVDVPNKDYVVLVYDTDNDSLSVHNESGENIQFKTNNSKNRKIEPIEYIGLDGTPVINNCEITKTGKTYTLKGSLTNGTVTYLIALEFSTDTDTYTCLIVDNKNHIVTLYTVDKTIECPVDHDITLSEINGTTIDGIVFDENNTVENTNSSLSDYLVNVLPAYVIELYNNNEYYYDDNTGLKIQIIKQLCKKLNIDSKVQNDETNANPFYVYVPLNFEISFYTNDNTGDFYDSLPINAKFIEENVDSPIDIPETIHDAKENNCIIVDATIEKAGAYKAIFTYSKDNDINISVDKLYSIPYIGKDNYWYINDIQTEVTATGKDAGNPNIVILKTELDENVITYKYTHSGTLSINDDEYYKQSKPTILHSYDGAKLGTAFDDAGYELVEFSYFLQTGSVQVADSTTNMYKFKVKLPILYSETNTLALSNNDLFESIIKNSLFFYVVDNRLSLYNTSSFAEGTFNLRELSLQYALTKNVNQKSFTTVLFQIVKGNNGKYVWNPILDNNSVLDLGSMIAAPEFASLFSETGYSPDKYKFSHLIFDNIPVQTKTGDNTERKEIFPVIKNDDQRYYTNPDAESIQDATGNLYYKGNLNLTPKFVKMTVNDLSSDLIGNVDIKDNGENSRFFSISDDGVISNKTFTIDTNDKDNIPASITGANQVNDALFPMFDFREVLTANQTAMNRLSVVSVSSNGKAYNAYIGNSAEANSEEGVLYIGSSNTNYSMSGNKTLTENYNKFAKFNRVNIELPTETKRLNILKTDNDDKYFAYIGVNYSDKYITATPHTLYSKYMGNATYKTYTFNFEKFITDNYVEFVDIQGHSTVELNNVTYNDENIPDTLLFLVKFSDFSNGKYNVEDVEQIMDNTSVVNGILELGNSELGATTAEPTGTTEPEITEEPDITGEPNNTTEPDITGEPDITTEPDNTTEPENTTEPDITGSPDNTNEPDITEAPDITDAPEVNEDGPEVNPDGPETTTENPETTTSESVVPNSQTMSLRNNSEPNSLDEVIEEYMEE